MDITKYIESGLLEGYLLDALSLEEKAQVERDLKDSKELRAALHQLEFEFEQLAYVLEKAPSPAVWDKIESSLELKKAEEKVEEIEETLVDKSESSRSNVTELDPTSEKVDSSIWKYWSFAASIAAILFLFLWQSAETQKQVVSSELQVIKQELQKTGQEKAHFASLQEKLVNPDFATIQLAAADPKMAYQAKVMWNQKTGEVLFATQTIPDLTAEQDLQLWALVDGKPINAGVISTDGNAAVTVQSIQIDKADLFAVTIEPKGGKPEPTLTQLVLIGKTTP